MVLSFVLAVLIGLGGSDDQPEPRPIPESPAAALSLEHVEPDLPVADPWPMPPIPDSSQPASHEPPGGQSPERIFVALMFTLILAGAAGRKRARAAAATASVRSDLQDNLFSDVTHTDLASIEETLVGLTAWERDLAIEGLSDREVAVWMRELDGWSGSYSVSEEASLFAGIVPGLRAGSLARFVEGGKGEEVTRAVLANDDGYQTVTLASDLAARLDPLSDDRELVAWLFEKADPTAVEDEVAEWVASGELGRHLDRLFAIDGEVTGYRLDAAAALSRSAAGFSDPAVKAALFAGVVDHLAEADGKRRAGSVDEVLAGTIQLLRSDPTGVVSQLNHGVDPHGNATAQWVEMMIDEDRIDGLDVILADLLGGSDRLGRFSDPGLNPAHPYPHASNLGYFVGSYQLAIEQMADDAEGTIQLVGSLFAIVTGVIPGPKGGSVSLPLGPLIDLHARDVIEGFRGDATQVKQTLWGLAKPRTDEGLLWNGPGTTQFQDAWEEVVEVR